MQGSIDVVRPDGLIEGWCWNEASPESRVSITVLIDGIEVGSCLAAQYREDLRQAKIGDGFCAFSFVTQSLPRTDKRTQTYTLIETESRVPIGSPLVVHNKEAISLDNRLIELETRNRLLTARLEEFAQREAQTSSSELFAVVGEFFTRLSKDMQQGEPLSIHRRLGDIVDTTTKAHRPIVLPVPEHPSMTILVQASTSLAQLHACLTSLQRAGVGSIASVVVIDSGQSHDVVLAPSVVRGIRYMRTVTDLTVEWADAKRAAGTDLVMMLSGTAIVSEDFLRDIVDAFSNNHNAGAIGGHALTPWAAACGGGLCMVDGALKDCVKAGHPEAKAELTGTYPAHALSYQAVAFRAAAVQKVGSLDAAFGDDLGAAVIDLCLRLRQSGWSVLAQPTATLELQSGFGEDAWMPRGLEGVSRAADLLRARWFDSPLPSPPLFIRHAAVLGVPGLFRDELVAVRRLREWGYSVEYVGPQHMAEEDERELRRAGVCITASEVVGATLRSCGATIIYAAASSAVLNSIPEGSRVVIGHMALNQAHESAEDFADDPPARQVAGL
jgi:hypothetical protein